MKKQVADITKEMDMLASKMDSMLDIPDKVAVIVHRRYSVDEVAPSA